MALTIKLLKSMGIDDEKIEAIIAAHTETTDGLKADRDKFKEQAEKVPDLKKQLEEAERKLEEAATETDDEWEQKYNDERKAFEDFKAQVEADKAAAEKAQAYRAMLMDAGVDPKRIESVMKVTDLSAVEMEDGKLKDADKLKASAKEEWADFIVKTKTEGADPATPPTNTGGVEGADPDVAKRMMERNERMFGKSDSKE